MEKVVDIVMTAIANEIRSRRLYSAAAEMTSDGEAQMVFHELVEMEDQHARLLVDRFGATLAEHEIDAEVELERLESQDTESPLVPETELIKKGDMRAVIEFAIRMEAEARDHYVALGERVEDPALRSLCDDLAAEEQVHHTTLSNLRISVDTPIDERPAL